MRGATERRVTQPEWSERSPLPIPTPGLLGFGLACLPGALHSSNGTTRVVQVNLAAERKALAILGVNKIGSVTETHSLASGDSGLTTFEFNPNTIKYYF